MATEPLESRDMPERSPKESNAVALKYLELARNEILERIKVRYQTLTVYAGRRRLPLEALERFRQ